MFKVSARMILELGSELISSDIIAFYELIKNGFDARTNSGVEIHFNVILRRNSYLTLSHRAKAADTDLAVLREATSDALNSDAPAELILRAEEILKNVKSAIMFPKALREIYALSTIVVSDTGSGMSLDDLNKNFLVLGTSCRKREVDAALLAGATKSPYLGEKGIGRLSAMRLGHHLKVETARSSDAKLNLLEVDWNEFANLDAMLDEIEVAPVKGPTKSDKDWSGTRIIISDLAEDWTEARVKDLVEKEFSRLTDPFLDQKRRPRVVIFWNGERQTVPWMEQKLLDHAHARVKGEYTLVKGKPQLSCVLEALDLGFDHPKEIERTVLTAPDLEAALIGVAQNLHDGALFATGPFSFEAHWFNRKRLGAIDGIGEMKRVRELQQQWSGILLFRDGFRVFPYGEEDDDWLRLDRRALSRSGYLLNKTQFIGRVSVSRAENPALVDQTNREGLRETPEQQILLGILQLVIGDLLLNFLKHTEKQYKNQKIDLSEAKTEITGLEERARTALRQLKKVAPKEGQEAVEDLQQAMLEFTDFAERARQRISEVEQESRQMVEMAGVGLMVEVVAHELARASENALQNLEVLRKRGVPDEIKGALESLRAQMKSLSKRVRILDPLSISGRQRSEIFALDDLVRETVEAHEAQFKRHEINLIIDLPSKSVRVKAVKGMIVQILENLISNSKYWMQMRKDREGSLQRTIKIALHDGPPTIIYEDNGRGIAPENREKIFKPFFSLKEKSKRRGLGLFIARECAQYNGGTLELDETRNAETDRLHRFTFELPASSTVP